MEDVRTVRVDQDARVIVSVVGVAADVGPLVHHQHSLTELGRQAFGDHAACEARADDQRVESMARLDGGHARASAGFGVLQFHDECPVSGDARRRQVFKESWSSLRDESAAQPQ